MVQAGGSGSDPAGAKGDVFKMAPEGISIKSTGSTEHEAKFTVKATAHGGAESSVKFEIQFVKNKAPHFKAPVEAVTISVSEAEQEEGIEPGTYIFRSPIATDEEGNAITMEFGGDLKLPC